MMNLFDMRSVYVIMLNYFVRSIDSGISIDL